METTVTTACAPNATKTAKCALPQQLLVQINPTPSIIAVNGNLNLWKHIYSCTNKPMLKKTRPIIELVQ